MNKQYIQVQTTTNSSELAEKIVQKIIGQRLAACAQILGPIQSCYWWEGQVVMEQEWKCFFKTRKNLYQPLEREIKLLHTYKIPEIIAMAILEGDSDYLSWIKEECSPDE